MKHEPEPILVSAPLTVVWSGRRILQSKPPDDWKIVCENPQFADAQFVRISSDLGHVAWWHRPSEQFCVAKTNGTLLWERRINTDKAVILDIRFSPSGDAVACFDEYDGGYRVHLYSIAKGYTTEFGPSFVPIGSDPELRRFAGMELGLPRDPFGPPGLACNPRVITIRDRRGTVRDTLVLPEDEE